MTFAVILVGGKQYKVREKDEIQVEKLDVKEGDHVKLKEVLLISEDDASEMKLGTPYVAGAHVECMVMDHGRGEKIRVFKMQSKKRYTRTYGHRQSFTGLKILKISAMGAKKAEKSEGETEKASKVLEKEEKVEAPKKKLAAKKPKVAKKD